MTGNIQRTIGPHAPPIAVDWELAFAHAATRQASAYWTTLCNGRTMPQRSELSPRAMRGFLAHVNLVDIVPDEFGTYRVGLEGSHVREVFGRLVHRALHELLTEEAEQRWRYCFDLVRQSSRPVRLSTRVGTQQKLWLECEVFLAPLTNVAGSLESLFWVFASWRAEAGPTQHT